MTDGELEFLDINDVELGGKKLSDFTGIRILKDL